MAWNDDTAIVVAVCAGHRTNRGGLADAFGNVGVGACFAGRDLQELIPYTALKIGSACCERQRENLPRSRKVLTDFSRGLIEHRMRARHDREFGVRTQAHNFALQPTPIDPIENVYPVVIGQRQNRTQRRIDPLGQQAMHIARFRGCRAKQFAEGFAKAA